MRHRDIGDIHRNYQFGLRVRSRNFSRFREWVDECEGRFNRDGVRGFWGYVGKGRIIFRFSSEGYNYGYVSSLSQIIEVSLDRDLPLMIEDPVYFGCRSLIEDRLSGKLRGLPQYQDLVDDYFRGELREEHCYRVLRIYSELLSDYLRELYRFRGISDKLCRNASLRVLRVSGHAYYFLRDFRLIDCNDIQEVEV